MGAGGKSRFECGECGAAYSIDLARVPPGATSFKCLKCSSQVDMVPVPQPAGAKGKDAETARGLQAPAPLPELSETQTEDSDRLPPVPVVAVAPARRNAVPEPEPSGERDDDWEYGRYRFDAEEENTGWLMTYGDMMSLLLVFFILLFAFSNIDKKKFQDIMGAISGALGGHVVVVPGTPPPPGTIPQLPPDPLDLLRQAVEMERSRLSGLQTQLQKLIEENNIGNRITLNDENEGLVLVVQDMIMFDSGRAEIREEMRPYLQKIGSVLRNIGSRIAVEGHTDDVPIHNERFFSNWELSVTRATNVVHFFLEQCGLDPARLTASGYAFYKPRYDLNSTDREKNRRIEVVIKKKYSDEFAEELIQSLDRQRKQKEEEERQRPESQRRKN